MFQVSSFGWVCWWRGVNTGWWLVELVVLACSIIKYRILSRSSQIRWSWGASYHRCISCATLHWGCFWLTFLFLILHSKLPIQSNMIFLTKVRVGWFPIMIRRDKSLRISNLFVTWICKDCLSRFMKYWLLFNILGIWIRLLVILCRGSVGRSNLRKGKDCWSFIGHNWHLSVLCFKGLYLWHRIPATLHMFCNLCIWNSVD